MTKLIAAAAMASVVCSEPVKCNGVKYVPGERIDGLTEKQADALVGMSHAQLVTDSDDGSAAATTATDVSDTVSAAVAAAAPAAAAAAKTTSKKR